MIEKNLKFFNLAVFYGTIYFLICLFFLFSITAPSDPMQYVKPALYPEGGFEFLDRISLWLWIRFVALFPIQLEYIGGIATLLLTTFTLILGLFWLYKKINLYAMNLFFLLFVLNNIILPISSYTYPTQMLTLVIFATLIAISLIENKKIAFLIGGIGASIAILSKIQAYPFFIFLFFYVIFNSKGLREIIKNQLIAFVGIISGFFFVFLIIFLIDNMDMVYKIVTQYFASTVEVQAKGRNLGGVPPFDQYLKNPTVLFALIGCLAVLTLKQFKELNIFALGALFQFLGLLLIYIVTQRGGPLIDNYILDFVVIGLFVFSGFIGKLFYEDFKTYHKYLMILPLFTILSIFYWIYVFNNSLDKNMLKIIFITLVLIISLFFLYKKKLKVTLFIICVFLVAYNTQYGVENALFKKHYWNTSYTVAKNISLANEKYIWLAAKINRNTIEDGSWRVKEIYTTFYENKNKFIHFGNIEPKQYELIITDSAYLINKYTDSITLNAIDYRIVDEKGKYNIKNKILFEKKGTEKVVVMLDYSFMDYNLKLKNNTEFILSSEIDVEKSKTKGLDMFIQYKIKDKYVRTLAKKDEKNYELIINIPKGAEEILYGWLINDIKDTVKINDIKFQNILIEDVANNHLKYIGIK